LDSFISLYVRILNFPADVVNALATCDINLFEATQLSRLTPEGLNLSSVKARELRSEIIRTHLLTQGSEASMRSRVIEHLGGRTVQLTSKESRDLGINVVDELIELNPYDTRHLFWEELRRIALALRQVTPDDLDDKILDDFLSASDQLSSVLARVEKRRQQENRSHLKIGI
jgi:hypothetical protein